MFHLELRQLANVAASLHIECMWTDLFEQYRTEGGLCDANYEMLPKFLIRIWEIMQVIERYKDVTSRFLVGKKNIE